MAEQHQKFKQGVEIRPTDKDFEEGMRAAVDYRGDVSVTLKDGSVVEGFLFNFFNRVMDLFPKNSPQKLSVSMDDVTSIVFSGKDEALGKSWEDYMKKRAQAARSHGSSNLIH